MGKQSKNGDLLRGKGAARQPLQYASLCLVSAQCECPEGVGVAAARPFIWVYHASDRLGVHT